jgi:hypothetical protein
MYIKLGVQFYFDGNTVTPKIFVFILLSKQDLFFKTKKERDMQFICTLFFKKY